jgi:glycosyltransferase involved in cell wall biosynthesis
MRILFIHQNFPGQFKHLAAALAKRGHEVKALAITPRAELPGVQVMKYAVPGKNGPSTHPWLLDLETKTIRAEHCARKLLELQRCGYTPDVVVGHPGWGETLLVKDVWPEAAFLAFLELFYREDSLFDPEFAVRSFEQAARIRMKNAAFLVTLDAMDWGLSPTSWQAAHFPPEHRERISVIFDGVDTAAVRPAKDAWIHLEKKQKRLSRENEVITFVNRNLEPYRGYHRFMRALPRILELRPNAEVVLVGGDGVSYGAPCPNGTWKETFLNEVKDRLDLSRVHFVGRVPYPLFLNLLQISSCHVYLTVPFVLSWSLIEAMSAGCVVVGSRTAPVMEVVEDGKNGLLVDFFDTDELTSRVVEVLSSRERFASLGLAARRTVEQHYALSKCLPKQLELVESMPKRRKTSPSTRAL